MYRIHTSFCIPESLNTNISHQLFDLTITQQQKTNSKYEFEI